MTGRARPRESGGGVRYWWTSVYLCVMATVTFLAVIFDWTVSWPWMP